jgi:cysteine-rich repeat protein
MAPLIALLVAACAESHDVDDASRPDSARPDASSFDAGRRDAARADAGPPDSARRDAGAPDAGCLDGDGDGALAVDCGGDDCDDRDPEIFPGWSQCDGPTAETRCEAGSLRTESCVAPEVCDARSGACSLDGCGDGVLHEGEECDDGNEERRDGCTASCAFEPCADSTVCPALADFARCDRPFRRDVITETAGS